MSYAGDVTPQEAYAAVTGGDNAVLVDVRTRAEWTYVGVPDLTVAERQVVFLEWQHFPSGELNRGFVAELRRLGLHEGTSLYFLCRSGVRSRAAASAADRRGHGPGLQRPRRLRGALRPQRPPGRRRLEERRPALEAGLTPVPPERADG